MGLVAAIREMLAKGLSIEQALMAAEIIEAREASELEVLKAEDEARRAHVRDGNRERQQRRRAAVTRDMRDNALHSVTPPKQKEPFPPTPPLLEKLNPPFDRDADASLVPEVSGTREINDLRKERVTLFQTVVAMWNELAAANRLVSVRDITATRQAAIVARSEDLIKTYDFPDALAGWRKLMGLVRGSPFLRGELNGFRCDFDFVTRASSFTKIMEGKYEARPARR